jgi:hypothetical protein
MSSNALLVLEAGRELTFSLEEMQAYHGGHSPAGVAHAFKVLERALPLLEPTGRVERREIRIDTPFAGPGARDGFELVTRAVTDGRHTVDPTLARPELGRARERFVFRLRYRDRDVMLLLREGFVPDEFVTLTGKDELTKHEQNLLTALKAEMAARVMAAPAAEVYDAVGDERICASSR